MTLEQLEKRRDSCEKQISSAEKEIEKIDKQIEELVIRETKPVLVKNHLSIADFLQLRSATKEEFDILRKILKKEAITTGDEQK